MRANLPVTATATATEYPFPGPAHRGLRQERGCSHSGQRARVAVIAHGRPCAIPVMAV